MQLQAPPLLSRILLAASSVIAVGVIFIFVSRALEPANIPPPTPLKTAEQFNPKADVSNHPVFKDLETGNITPVPDMPLGRENPFIAVPSAPTTTIPAEGVAIPGSRLRVVPAPVEATGSDMEVMEEASTSSNL
ncbi:MAG: hypothetical protein ACOYUZ_06540 [Patescibacteria group bacterium]